MPILKTKTEIEFSVEEIEQILSDYLIREFKINGEQKFTFKVINRPYPCGAYDDLCDNYQFYGVKIEAQDDEPID